MDKYPNVNPASPFAAFSRRGTAKSLTASLANKQALSRQASASGSSSPLGMASPSMNRPEPLDFNNVLAVQQQQHYSHHQQQMQQHFSQHGGSAAGGGGQLLTPSSENLSSAQPMTPGSGGQGGSSWSHSHPQIGLNYINMQQHQQQQQQQHQQHQQMQLQQMQHMQHMQQMQHMQHGSLPAQHASLQQTQAPQSFRSSSGQMSSLPTPLTPFFPSSSRKDGDSPLVRSLSQSAVFSGHASPLAGQSPHDPSVLSMSFDPFVDQNNLASGSLESASFMGSYSSGDLLADDMDGGLTLETGYLTGGSGNVHGSASGILSPDLHGGVNNPELLGINGTHTPDWMSTPGTPEPFEGGGGGGGGGSGAIPATMPPDVQEFLESELGRHIFNVNPRTGASTPGSTPPPRRRSSRRFDPTASEGGNGSGQSAIPRPPNAFMIFRIAVHRRLVTPPPAVSTEDNKGVGLSRRLAEAWRDLGTDGRRKYFELAELAKRAHELIYPGYKYKPRRNTAATASRLGGPPAGKKGEVGGYDLSEMGLHSGASSSPSPMLTPGANGYQFFNGSPAISWGGVAGSQLSPAPHSALASSSSGNLNGNGGVWDNVAPASAPSSSSAYLEYLHLASRDGHPGGSSSGGGGLISGTPSSNSLLVEQHNAQLLGSHHHLHMGGFRSMPHSNVNSSPWLDPGAAGGPGGGSSSGNLGAHPSSLGKSSSWLNDNLSSTPPNQSTLLSSSASNLAVHMHPGAASSSLAAAAAAASAAAAAMARGSNNAINLAQGSPSSQHQPLLRTNSTPTNQSPYLAAAHNNGNQENLAAAYLNLRNVYDMGGHPVYQGQQ